MRFSVVSCLTILYLQASFGCRRGPENSELSWRAFEIQCLAIRSLESRLLKVDDLDRIGLAEECLTVLAQQPMGASSQGSTFQNLYRARLLMVSANKEQAQMALHSLPLYASVTPEALSLLYELSKWARETPGPDTANYCGVLAQLVPISPFRGCVDGASWLGSGERPLIPWIRPLCDEFLTVVADGYFKMQMFGDASRAYREIIYGSFFPTGVLFSFGHHEEWLSPSTARLWLKVAESEWYCGNTEAAADYLAKCIVFGSEEDLVPAIKLLHEFEKQGNRKRPIPAPKPNREKLLEITEMYAEQNMHPRAIELLQRFEKTIGADAKMLEAKYQKEWQDLVRRYVDHADRAVLFGQEVYSKEKGYNFAINTTAHLG